jgi:hypothetical protein
MRVILAGVYGSKVLATKPPGQPRDLRSKVVDERLQRGSKPLIELRLQRRGFDDSSAAVGMHCRSERMRIEEIRRVGLEGVTAVNGGVVPDRHVMLRRDVEIEPATEQVFGAAARQQAAV